jgi:drug/metabolite transporter (DMT)-like permease
VGLFTQVVAAAAYAWLLLGEQLLPVQMLGGAVVLLAIGFALAARRTAALTEDQVLRASLQPSMPRQSESR